MDDRAVGGGDRDGQAGIHCVEFVHACDAQHGPALGVDVARPHADRDDPELVGGLRPLVRIRLGVAEQVEQTGADDPVSRGQRVDAVAGDQRVGPYRLDHALVGNAVEHLLVEAELLEVGVEVIKARGLESLGVLGGQAAVVHGRRDDRIADLLETPVVVDQVRHAAVPQFGEVGHQSMNDVSPRQVARQGHCPHLLGRLHGGPAQFLVNLVVDLLAGIVVDVIEPGRDGLIRQIHPGALRPAAGFVEDQAGGIQFTGEHGAGVQQLLEHGPLQLVEQFPLHDAGPVAVPQDAAADLVGNPTGQPRCLDREVHALDCQRTDRQHAEFVGQIEPHRRRRLAPWADHVEARFLRQPDLARCHLAAVGVRQLHRIQALEERGLEEHRLAVEIEFAVADRELAHPESGGELVEQDAAASERERRPVEVGIVRRPVPGIGDRQLCLHRGGARVEFQRSLPASDRFIRPIRRADRQFRVDRRPLLAAVFESHVEGSDVGGDPRHDEYVVDVGLAGGDQSDGLPDAAGDRAAPLRRLHLADALDALVRHKDRPGDAHHERVDLARLEGHVHAEFEGREPALVEAHRLVVEPDLGLEVDRVEVQSHGPPCPIGRDGEVAAIPGYALVVLLVLLPAARHGNRASARRFGKAIRNVPAGVAPLVL